MQSEPGTQAPAPTKARGLQAALEASCAWILEVQPAHQVQNNYDRKDQTQR